MFKHQDKTDNMTDAQVAGGHKATLKNPNVSKEAKEHSKQVLEEQFGGDGLDEGIEINSTL